MTAIQVFCKFYSKTASEDISLPYLTFQSQMSAQYDSRCRCIYWFASTQL